MTKKRKKPTFYDSVKNDCRDTSESSGFTLVEIIITIVLIGILGAISAQFMASALVDSTQPIDRVQEAAGRVSIMEKIISDYVIAMNSDSYATALTTIETNVSNGNYNTGDTSVTTERITFDGSGQETTVSGDNLKVSVTTGNAVIVTILSTTRNNSSDPMVNF